MGLLSCRSELTGFRLRAVATSRRVTEQPGRRHTSCYVRVHSCACMLEGLCLLVFLSDSTGLLELIVHPQRLISEALKGEQEQSVLTRP